MTVMNNDANKLIASLTPQIEEKCAEIKQSRGEKSALRLFMLLCAAVVLIPTLLVFFGISITALLIQAAFITVAFLALSPILIKQQRSNTYEQI